MFNIRRSAVLSFVPTPNTKFRCYAETTNEFFDQSTLFALIRAIPFQLLALSLVSFMLVMLWILFTDGRQQIARLDEAQKTISGLSIYRAMVQQELHDHIIQNLTLLGVQVATAPAQNGDGQKAARDSVLKQIDYLRRELRRFLSEGGQRLQSFDDMATQLRSICQHLEGQFKVRCVLTTTHLGLHAIPPELLFRTCRFAEELVGNAIRHGGAKKMLISVECDAGGTQMRVRVEDDGKGFDPDSYCPGFGLQNMAAFARRSRGSLDITRRQPCGMIVELKVPITSFKG